MRKKLERLDGKRLTFTGVFERFGLKNSFGYDKRTVLLKNIRMNGRPICDHLWFNLTKGFEALGLEPGDVIRFDARSKSYIKGYLGWRDDVFDKPPTEDYKLSHPTRVTKITPQSITEDGRRILPRENA